MCPCGNKSPMHNWAQFSCVCVCVQTNINTHALPRRLIQFLLSLTNTLLHSKSWIHFMLPLTPLRTAVSTCCLVAMATRLGHRNGNVDTLSCLTLLIDRLKHGTTYFPYICQEWLLCCWNLLSTYCVCVLHHSHLHHHHFCRTLLSRWWGRQMVTTTRWMTCLCRLWHRRRTRGERRRGWGTEPLGRVGDWLPPWINASTASAAKSSRSTSLWPSGARWEHEWVQSFCVVPLYYKWHG